MIRAALVLVALALTFAPAARAEDIVSGLSKNRVSISANFDGTEILVFGAVKREAPIEPGRTGVIVTVEGPAQEVTVRRKDRRAVIWINNAALEVDHAPSFYAVNASGPIDDILSRVEDLRHGITTRSAIRQVGGTAQVDDPSAFVTALIRIREAQGLFQSNPRAVTVRENTLFDTSFTLPANLVEGVYTSRIFLTRDGQIVAEASSSIYVEKVGLERFLYNLAHENPALYGIMSLVIAVAAGWGASAAFRYLNA
ncbi:hypothetical protein E2L08_04510 [Palleronia sediminis]|uniref:Transmembrane protein n=1 Tax=Palleronia sediminis TaxID=2547833 RepID=A0A4R6ADJ5_9RHOB|nr:TIGR02186 family protein [Palleronia sediminis]TDL81920.1 hypothetical protein E2L08_04510 [Palleronia sediminis]